jgi:hypothetical protein
MRQASSRIVWLSLSDESLNADPSVVAEPHKGMKVLDRSSSETGTGGFLISFLSLVHALPNLSGFTIANADDRHESILEDFLCLTVKSRQLCV